MSYTEISERVSELQVNGLSEVFDYVSIWVYVSIVLIAAIFTINVYRRSFPTKNRDHLSFEFSP